MRTIARGIMVVGALLALPTAASAATITIQGTTVQGPANCYPFGGGTGFSPFAGFIYQNIPAFTLGAGDKVAFDLGAVNTSTIVLDIAMAHTVSNGSQQQDASGFTTIITAGSPTGMGDTVLGNYDLVFTAQSPFAFPGGGLIIRFKAAGAYASVGTCNQVLGYSSAGDSSGLFVARFYSDADGVFPFPNNDTSSIGIVRITTSVHAMTNGPYTGSTGAPVSLNATGTNSADGAITLYEWDCTNDGIYDTSGASPTGATCTYAIAGTYTAKLRATDSLAHTGTATATVTIIGPPLIAPSTATLAPRASQTFTASSGSGAGYTFSFTTNASGGTINSSTGVYVAGSTPNVTDVVKVTDSAMGTASATVTVGPGVAVSPATPSSPPRGTLTFTSTGGSATGFSYALTTNASGGTINSSTGAYVAGSTGAVTDTVTATDSLGNTKAVNVTVGAAVSLSPATPTTPPRGPLTFTATGGSGTGFAYVLMPSASGGTINSSTGAYVAGSTGSTTDTVIVIDSLGNTKSVNVSVGAGVAIAPASPTSAPRGSRTFTATGGNGSFTFSLTTNGSGGSITTGGVYAAGSTGSTSDIVRVVDTLGNQATTTVTVGPRVSVTPSAPTLAPGASATLAVAGGSGTGYSYALTTNGSSGAVTAAGVYTAGRTGTSSDVVTVTDSLGNTATSTISVGPAVSATPAMPTSPPRGALTFTATGGSGTGFTWTLAGGASGGAIDGTGHYTAGNTGSVTDDIRVTDSLGNTALVHIGVTAAVSVSPVMPSTPPRGALLFTATGGSGTGYTFAVTTNGSGGAFAAGGNYTAGATGNTSDTVTVTDSLGNVAVLSVSVGAGIILNPASTTSPPHGHVAFTAMGGSGTGYLYALSTNASQGSVDASGNYSAGSTGSVGDAVTVTDSLGNTATAAITVGPGLSVSPVHGALAPRGSLAFSVSGGSGAGYAWSLTGAGSGGTIDATSGAYVAGASGNHTDVAQVTDSLGNSATVSIDVGPGVTLSAEDATVPPRGSDAVTAMGGSGSFVYSIATDASGGASINSMTGAFVAGATPNVADVVRVVDSNNNSATFSIMIGPGIGVAPATRAAPPRGTISFVASGGSGSGYTWALTTNASGGTVTTSGAYTAGATANTADVVAVTDTFGNTAAVTISVGGGLAINPTAPTAPPRGSVTLSVAGGSGIGYTWSLSTNASGGTINATTGAYTAGVTGGVTDVARVVDSLGNPATVSITVGPRLTIQPPNASALAGASVLFSVMGGSGSGLQWTIPTNASGGTVNATTGAYRAGSASGSDTVRVTDSLGNTSDANVTVTAPAPVTDAGTDVRVSDAGVSDAGAGDHADSGSRDASIDSGVKASGSGGCSCDLGGNGRSGTGFVLVALAALILRRGRRSRR
jgi:PKD domain